MATRLLLFSAAINPQTTSALMQHLVQAYNDATVSGITIAFASTGGDVHSGVALYGVLRAAPKPVTMHAIGTVASIGITAYLGAQIRRATQGCLFFFHPMSAPSPVGSMNRITIEEAAQMLEADEARLGALWQERTLLDANAISELFRSSTMKSVSWGRENGFVTEIADLIMPVNTGMVAVAT